MKLMEYASLIAGSRSSLLDFSVYSLLAIVSPVAPQIPMGEDFQAPNINMLYIGDIGIGKSSLLMKLYRLTPKAEIADKLTEGSVIGVYSSQRKDIVFPLIESCNNGVLYCTEFDKMMSNKRLQGLLRRIMERYPVKVWVKDKAREIKPNISIIASANPKGDVLAVSNILSHIVFDLGLLNRFDYIKVHSWSKEELNSLADEIASDVWVYNASRGAKLSDVKGYLQKLYSYLSAERENIIIDVPRKYVLELKNFFIEHANPEDNPLHNIRVFVSALKILNASIVFHLWDRKVRSRRYKATEEDLEVAKMYLVQQLENLNNIVKFTEGYREHKNIKIMVVYRVLKELYERQGTGDPVKMSQVIRECVRKGIASENTIRRYIDILENAGLVEKQLIRTVYFVKPRHTKAHVRAKPRTKVKKSNNN